MRKNTILETVTAVVFLIFVGVILYYSFYPFKVTTLDSIGINGSQYCRGEWVEVDMQFTKHLDVEAKVVWYIVDGVVYQLDSPGVNRPQGENHITVSKQIPHSILPGKYHMRVQQTYEVHPLHKPIINTWNTPTFEVLGDKDCPTITEEPLNKESRPDVDQNKPLINESSKPLPGVDTTSKQAGDSAQPIQQEVIVEQNHGEPQTHTPEQKTPIKDLIDRVKGML